MNQMCFYHVKRAVLCCFNISLAYLVLSLRVNRCDIIGMFLVWPGYTFLFFNSPSGMGFLSFSVILSYIILFIILLILGFRFIMGIRWGRQKQRHWTVRLPSTTACCAWSSACPELYNPDLVPWPPSDDCTLSEVLTSIFPVHLSSLFSLFWIPRIIYREILCAPMSCHSFFFSLFLSYALRVLANDEKASYNNNNSNNVHILNLSEMSTAGWPTICRRSRS